MPLPINIAELINGTTVEWERIEFKEGWNDLDILHTICAFANDFSNLGGGYVIAGIAEHNGKPILPPKGLTPAQADKIQKDLLNLCKQRLKPDYTPIVEPVTFQGKLILVIWCPGGQERPYEAPDSFAKGATKYYYIRKFSNTIKSNKTEREELLRFAAVPYDDRINYNKNLKDLSPGLIRSFLQEIKSKLFDDFDMLSFVDVCRQMNLIEGSNEYIKPKNFALMFFNDHPEKIFPKAQIEIVSFQTNVADKNFTETNFEGPIHHQLRDALRYLKTQVIKEKVEKVSYKAEAIRYFNFPYEALEEALANAVYHRSYEITEPIEIRIHLNRIYIISYPGPDASIKMEEMQNGRVVIRRYLNRQIGNMLKELKLTEGKCTGIPTILKSMKNNGSPKPLFETDEYRQSLAVTFNVHPAFEKINFSNLSLTPTAKKIVEICIGEPVSASEIAKQLKVQVNSGGFRKAITQLLNEGLIAYTMPDIPKSRLQKYTITNKGEQYLGKEKDNDTDF
jgi:ATP-dependent DNA helicase RecG